MQGADLEGQPFSFIKEVIWKCSMSVVTVSTRDTNHNTFSDLMRHLEGFQIHFFQSLQQVTFTVEGRVHQVREEPYVFLQRWAEGKQVCVTCRVGVSFHSHYGEPLLHQEVTVHRGKGQRAMTATHSLIPRLCMRSRNETK